MTPVRRNMDVLPWLAFRQMKHEQRAVARSESRSLRNTGPRETAWRSASTRRRSDWGRPDAAAAGTTTVGRRVASGDCRTFSAVASRIRRAAFCITCSYKIHLYPIRCRCMVHPAQGGRDDRPATLKDLCFRFDAPLGGAATLAPTRGRVADA